MDANVVAACMLGVIAVLLLALALVTIRVRFRRPTGWPWRFVLDLWFGRRKLSVGLVQYPRDEHPRAFTATRYGMILTLPARHLLVVWR